MINEVWLNHSNDHAWLYSGAINGNFVAFHIHERRANAAIYPKLEKYELEDILHIERESLAGLVEHIEQVYSVKICFRNATEEIVARAHPAKPKIKERFGLDDAEDIPPTPSRRRMKANLQKQEAINQVILGNQLELSI